MKTYQTISQLAHPRAKLPSPTAYDEFVRLPNPANAIALAIADHQAAGLIDWDFVDQLRKAQSYSSQHAELLAALERAAKHLSDIQRIRGIGHDDVIEQAYTAIRNAIQ